MGSSQSSQAGSLKREKTAAEKAREVCPEVPQNVHCHLIRKTKAMDLYRNGIPLPFISYGGTSVLFLLIEMGIVMSVCDTVCAISFGQMLAIGTTEAIQKNKAVQEAYLGAEEDEQ